MKSVYLRVMAWSAAILLVCLGLFLVISRYMSYSNFETGGALAKLFILQSEETTQRFEHDGPQGLADHISNLESRYPDNHYYLSQNGRDLLTGNDISGMQRAAESRWERLHVGAPHIIARKTGNGRYVYMMNFATFSNSLQMYALYYLVLLSAIALLAWVLMFQFASPLNELAGVVRRFGDGELGARAKIGRRDSIGDLGTAFNQMADRIQTLLDAERQLLQDISHELRSPLARLSVAAELTRDAEEHEAAILQIHKEVDRLTELLEGLIQITRVEADPRAQKLGNVSVDDLVREVIEDCAIEANARDCQLRLRGKADLNLEADRELLR